MAWRFTTLTNVISYICFHIWPQDESKGPWETKTCFFPSCQQGSELSVHNAHICRNLKLKTLRLCIPSSYTQQRGTVLSSYRPSWTQQTVLTFPDLQTLSFQKRGRTHRAGFWLVTPTPPLSSLRSDTLWELWCGRRIAILSTLCVGMCESKMCAWFEPHLSG